MKHSITNRIIIGKTIGFIAGLSVFLIIPYMGAVIDLKLGIGMMFLYAMLGVLVAFMGMFDRHPILDFKMPWWFTGIILGLITHLIFILLSYDQIAIIIQQINLAGITSPWWALLDGAILGLLSAYAEKKFAGEGQLPLK